MNPRNIKLCPPLHTYTNLKSMQHQMRIVSSHSNNYNMKCKLAYKIDSNYDQHYNITTIMKYITIVLYMYWISIHSKENWKRFQSKGTYMVFVLFLSFSFF